MAYCRVVKRMAVGHGADGWLSVRPYRSKGGCMTVWYILEAILWLVLVLSIGYLVYAAVKGL